MEAFLKGLSVENLASSIATSTIVGFSYVQSEERWTFLPAAGREELPIYFILVAAARICCLAAEELSEG